MSSLARFNDCPAFPSDVRVANIPQVSLEKLANGDQQETETLFKACREYGFFLLDLYSSQDREELLKYVQNMFDVSKAVLTLDKSTLDRFAYKPPKDPLG